MSDSDDTFRVTDRRRRDDATEGSPRPAAEPPSPPPTSSSPAQAARASTPSESRSEADTERSLTGLFMMLASSAVVAMGAAPDPVSGQIRRDLEQATEVIDLLILLREKTEGNRTSEETRILDQLVYDLQLRYVSARKVAG